MCPLKQSISVLRIQAVPEVIQRVRQGRQRAQEKQLKINSLWDFVGLHRWEQGKIRLVVKALRKPILVSCPEAL